MFVENIPDPLLIERITVDYSNALGAADPASANYVVLYRHNAKRFASVRSCALARARA